MAAAFQLKDIDEVIASLGYANPSTQKYKLVRAVRQFYQGEDPSDFPKEIDAADLVKVLWDTGDDPALIKSKKKNLSSTKSAVNADLKKLFQSGGNPVGIIIGRSNVFDLSDEAKNKALTQLAESLGGENGGLIGRITEILETINRFLSDQESLSEGGGSGGPKTLDGMKRLIVDLYRKIDPAAADLSGKDHNAGAEHQTPADRLTDGDPADDADLPVEETIEAFVEETARDAAWQTSEYAETIENDDLYDEAFAAEDVVAESAPEDFFEADDLVEEIIDEAADAAVEISEITEDEGEGSCKEASADVIGISAASAEDGGDPIPDEYREAVTSKIDGLETIDEEIALDEAFPEEADVVEASSLAAEDDSELAPEENAEETDDFAAEAAAEEFAEDPEEAVEEVIEEDLQSRAEFLSSLAEAAKILEKLGPDFSDSVYNEQEIREKAKVLSEEFERSLAIKDRFFNQHILIKEGTYTVGNRTSGDHELPARRIDLPCFYIGKFPVTNGLFQVFVENTGYRTTAEKQGYGLVYTGRGRKKKDPQTGREKFLWSGSQRCRLVQGACWYHPSGPGSSIHDRRRHPVVRVILDDARAFAAWTGKRIPTEEEWEAASRTRLGCLYPWGSEWRDGSCNVEKEYNGDTTPVDRYLEYNNAFGLVDALGNVMEWTLDNWTSAEGGKRDPQFNVAKGGCWLSNGSLSLCTRFRIGRNTTSNILGFRCVAI